VNRIEKVSPGLELPRITLPVTEDSVSRVARASGDWYPGHHDRASAQGQGLETIYANVAFLQGLADRLVLEWAGEQGRIVRRTLRMASPLYAGCTAVVDGTVTAVDAEQQECAVSVTITSESGAPATVESVVSFAPGGDAR
jgi:acyl dehydratase